MPDLIYISSINLMLLIYIMGMTWSKALPRRSMVNGTRFAVLGPLLEIINHGEFRIKEVCSAWILGILLFMDVCISACHCNLDCNLGIIWFQNICWAQLCYTDSKYQVHQPFAIHWVVADPTSCIITLLCMQWHLFWLGCLWLVLGEHDLMVSSWQVYLVYHW